MVNGAWGGRNLIPLHYYAQRDLRLTGASYLISYASGSMMVCVAIWMGVFLYHLQDNCFKVKDALEALPKWHVNELGVPGLLTGLLYTFGNFCSILAVSYLGQGGGFSFCQGQLLISGLWGIFYFKEMIRGREMITKWIDRHRTESKWNDTRISQSDKSTSRTRFGSFQRTSRIVTTGILAIEFAL